LRYYLSVSAKSSFFFDLGTGDAYTSIHFKEQGTHWLFILQGGLGLKWRNFFIEDRFRHYSNAGTAHPNGQVNANIISIGIFF
jgi:hypothetical protein